MEDKILGFQFEPVSAKTTRPSYNNGSDQDEPQKQPPEVFCKKGVLRNFARFTENICASVSFLLKRGQETRHNRLSSQEWSNCQNCKKMPARLECGCCHEIPEAKAFNLKDEAKLYRIYRSSFSQMFFKIGVLKNFAIYTGKHLCWSLFNKIKRLYKRGLQHRCFPWILQNF